jgi:hypothetical protein
MKHAFKFSALTPIALALLAGCAQNTASLPPVTAPPVAMQLVADATHRITDPSMGPEVLAATHVAIESTESGSSGCAHRGGGVQPCMIMPSSWEASFKVKGTATGPIAGTFVANGNWRWNAGRWAFSESFTLKSGSAKIPGRIEADGTGRFASGGTNPAQGPPLSFGQDATFGPFALSYAADEDVRGRAFIAIIKRTAFNETLSNFNY